jgi:hypothetical protein
LFRANKFFYQYTYILVCIKRRDKMQPEISLSINLPKREATGTLRPMGWKLSLLFFGIPALVTVAAFHGFRPWLESQGYSELVSQLAATCVPLSLLFAAALIAPTPF